MNKILWKPKQVENTQMAKFMETVNTAYSLKLKTYADLFDWSVQKSPDFWEQIWQKANIIHSKPYTQIVDDVKKMPGAKWFSGARLNFAENLLTFRDDKIAIQFQGEGQNLRSLSYKELFDEVERLAHSLREMGVKKGDRVAGFIPNLPEAIIAM